MNWILKNKKKNSKTLLVVLFLSFGIFYSSNNAKAVEASCEGFNLANTTNNSGTFADGKFLCTCQKAFDAGKCVGLKSSNEAECNAFKNLKDGSDKQLYSLCYFKGNGDPTAPGGTGTPNRSDLNPTGTGVSYMVDSLENDFTKAIKWMLVGVLNFVGWLFAIAATLFAWVVDPVNVSGDNGMLNKQAVKDVWIMVRDLLNMTFILILLFAAFCTIFQVDKWNLKKVWLNILINALLVNFSFPIARFFIDVSNVAFYYFVNHLFSSTTTVTGSSIFASLGASSKIGELLKPENYTQYSVAYLISMIIVVFIMGMTLMVIAGLFVVRLVALTMIVMFSPVGFVGYIFPSTSSYADKWWNNLFSYSFFAPIMIFIMAISVRITEALGNDNMRVFSANANANATPADANWISQAAFFVIPIIILWMGIGVAKSFGIAGADTVVGAVKKGGKWLANAPGKYSGVYGATKKATEDFNKKGKLFGKKVPFMGTETREQREARWAAFATGGKGGYDDAKRKIQDTKIADKMKEYKDRNYTADIIAKDLDSKNSHESMAAVRALISDKTAMSNPEILQKVLEKSGSNLELRHRAVDAAENVADSDKLDGAKLHLILNAATAGMSTADRDAMAGKIKGKVRKENVKKLLEYEKNHNRNGRSDTDIYAAELDRLNPESFGKQKKLHEDIGTDTALKNYVLANYANPTNNAAHQEAFGKMTNKARAAWAAQGANFVP